MLIFFLFASSYADFFRTIDITVEKFKGNLGSVFEHDHNLGQDVSTLPSA